MKYLNTIKTKFEMLVREHDLIQESVRVQSKALSVVDAIGSPIRRDYPLVKGKEVLMETSFKESKGQAYTDMPGYYEGTLGDVLTLDLTTNFNRAVFIATLNAVMRAIGKAEKTVHCKDEEPELCGAALVKYLHTHYKTPKVCLVGFQPALLEHLAGKFEVRVLDLDLDNIGREKYGVEVEDGSRDLNMVIDWCDIIIATGSTIVNDTIMAYVDSKPVVFYGTTIAGTASLLELTRFCHCSK